MIDVIRSVLSKKLNVDIDLKDENSFILYLNGVCIEVESYVNRVILNVTFRFKKELFEEVERKCINDYIKFLNLIFKKDILTSPVHREMNIDIQTLDVFYHMNTHLSLILENKDMIFNELVFVNWLINNVTEMMAEDISEVD